MLCLFRNSAHDNTAAEGGFDIVNMKRWIVGGDLFVYNKPDAFVFDGCVVVFFGIKYQIPAGTRSGIAADHNAGIGIIGIVGNALFEIAFGFIGQVYAYHHVLLYSYKIIFAVHIVYPNPQIANNAVFVYNSGRTHIRRVRKGVRPFLFYITQKSKECTKMTDEKVFFLTQEGMQELEAELEELKTKKRKEIAEKIKTAREFGDLSENAEYDQAKNEQAQIEERIMKIENMLRNAVQIEEDQLTDEHVGIGAKVKLLDEDFNEELEYTIVGTAEADPRRGRISNLSPVGRALLGKSVGDVVQVHVADNLSTYKVLEIIV
jgi:transcription elongation factor GreA